MPAAPVLPAAVPPVDPGVEPRFRALAKQIQAHASFNTAIGEALGIEGPEQSGPEMATIQPAITAKTQGNTVLVGWDWSGQRAFLDRYARSRSTAAAGRLCPALLQHHAKLHRHRALPGHAREMDLPRHLPRRRPRRRAME